MTDPTRRIFLLRLARLSAFVPPALVTVELAAQGPGLSPSNGGGKGGGKGKGEQSTSTNPVPSTIGPSAPWTIPPGK